MERRVGANGSYAIDDDEFFLVGGMERMRLDRFGGWSRNGDGRTANIETMNRTLPAETLNFSFDQPLPPDQSHLGHALPTLATSATISEHRRLFTHGGVASNTSDLPITPIPDLDTEYLEEDELGELHRSRRRDAAFKTALCDSVRQNRECPYGGSCTFAHSYNELRVPPPRGRRHPKYKTMLCDKFSVTGFCKYGERCQYIHKVKNVQLLQQRRLMGISDQENVKPDVLFHKAQRLAAIEAANKSSLASSQESSSSSSHSPPADAWSMPPIEENAPVLDHPFLRDLHDMNMSMPAIPTAWDVGSGQCNNDSAEPDEYKTKLPPPRRNRIVFPKMGREFEKYYTPGSEPTPHALFGTR